MNLLSEVLPVTKSITGIHWHSQCYDCGLCSVRHGERTGVRALRMRRSDIQEECVGLQDLLIQLNVKLSSGFICITVDACRDDPRNTTFAGAGVRGDTVTRSTRVKPPVKPCVQE